jgi:hypothetical protein
MRKAAAYSSMVLIVALLAAADYFVLTSARTLSRLGREKLREAFGDALEAREVRVSLQGSVALEGVTVQLGPKEFPPQEIGRAEIRFKGRLGGPIDRVVLEGLRAEISDRLLEELRRQTPGPGKKAIRDFFPDPDDLPRVVCRGGRVRASFREAFTEPQELEIRSFELAPAAGYRAAVGGEFASALYGTWKLRGEADLDAGAFSLALEAAGLRIVPAMQAPLTAPIRDIYDKYRPGGLCDLAIRLEGRPGAETDFKATLVARDMSLRYRHFPYDARELRGEIDFFLRGFRVKHMTARHGDATIRFDGFADGYPADAGYAFRLEMDGVPFDEDLYRALDPDGRRVWDRFRPGGRADVRGRVLRETGPDKPSRIPLDLSVREGSLRFEGFPYELKNIAGDLALEGSDVVIRRLTSSEAGRTVEIAGEIRDLAGDAAVDLTVDARGLALDDRLKAALGDETRKTWELFSPSGTIDGRCRLTKAKGGGLVPSLRARARGASLTYREIPLPASEVEGEVELLPDGTVKLHHLGGKAHGARVEVHGAASGEGVGLSLDVVGLPLDDAVKNALPPEIGDLLKQLRLSGVASFRSDFSLRGKQKKFTLDLKLSKGAIDIDPRFDDLEGHVALEGFLDSKVMVRGPLTFSGASVVGKRLTDVSATLNVNGTALVFENISARAYGGLVAGKSLFVDTKTGEFFGEHFTVDRLDIAQYVKDTKGFAGKQLAGKVSLEVRDLKGKAGEADTVTGAGRLTIRDALLWEIPIFVSLLKLNPQDLFKSQNRFDAGALDFEIRRRKFDIKNLLFTSETVSLVGRGRVGFDGDLHLKLRPKSGAILGIDILPVQVITAVLDALTGFVEVEVTGTFEKPEIK